MNNKVWKETIANILNSDDFKSQIQDRGYYLSPERRTFREYTDKDLGIISITNTANFLSKDFWHYQSKVLRNRGFYLIRTGKGSFAIFDEKRFARPYVLSQPKPEPIAVDSAPYDRDLTIDEILQEIL